jgi:hypothetical protein
MLLNESLKQHTSMNTSIVKESAAPLSFLDAIRRGSNTLKKVPVEEAEQSRYRQSGANTTSSGRNSELGLFRKCSVYY